MPQNANTQNETNPRPECNGAYVMKTRTFFCTLMLLALILCFSSEANAFQTSLIVTVYPERVFKGTTMNYAPGHYPLEGFTAGSIRVPPGY